MRLRVEPLVALALETAVVQAGNLEVSGFGWIKREGDVLTIYDYCVLHVGSWGFTQIDHSIVAKLAEREDAGNMKLWWHKHPIYGWSGTDEATIRDEPLGGIPELIQWSASMVRTPKGWIGRIDNHIHKITQHVEVEGFPKDVIAVVESLMPPPSSGYVPHTIWDDGDEDDEYMQLLEDCLWDEDCLEENLAQEDEAVDWDEDMDDEGLDFGEDSFQSFVYNQVKNKIKGFFGGNH